MEMSLSAKPRKPRGSKKTKKMKIELEDPSYDHSETFNSNVLQKAVNTIIYGDDDDDDYTPSVLKKKTPTKKSAEKFREPDTEHIVFHKVSIPKTMKSIYWKHFGFPADLNGEILTKRKIICTLCSSQFVYLQNTSNLKSHLTHKHPQAYARLIQNEQLMPTGGGRGCKKRKDMDPAEMFQVVDIPMARDDHFSICVQGENEGEQAIISIPKEQTPVRKRITVQPSHSRKSLIDLIVDFVILDLQPPSIVNNEGFRHLVSNLTSICEIPTEQSIIQDFVPKMYDSLKNAMYNDITAINMLDNGLTLALEHWMQGDREYISYYLNYLTNDDQFSTKLLHTFLLDNESIQDTFYHQEMFNIICTSWNIKTSNIRAVILASDNEALQQVVVHHDIPVIPCLNHTLSEMCFKAFQMSPIDAVIQKCRTVISQIYNKNNFAIHLTFPDQNGQMDDAMSSTFLSLDNPAVWTSTLCMLEALNAARSKLNVLLELGDGTLDAASTELDAAGQMNEEEWYIVSRVVEIFNPIRVTVVTLSEEKPAQASLILPLYLQLVNHHLKVQPEDDSLTSQLKSYFVKCLTDKYASVDALLQICTALDPRVKKLPYIEEQGVFDGPIKDMLLSAEPPESQSSAYFEEVPEQDTKKNIRLSGMEFLLGGVTSKPSHVKSSAPSHADNIRFETDRYIHMQPASLNECPLNWWKTNSNRFPNLFPLSLKYSCIPATCVPFSKAMEMKAQCNYIEKRKLLSLNMQAALNHLLFLHHNYSV